ncbi:hypothetical protein ANCCAN_05146 [Ancylostoma caninum]|uniref:Uncharacterized protein n=1 Tax=Ancylostoma caninum TaxID=29170 RepID=A0A368GWY0_ANCCA|nr:hypothetical protein ANCCAN_05146 [Ancylostoma caninum]
MCTKSLVFPAFLNVAKFSEQASSKVADSAQNAAAAVEQIEHSVEDHLGRFAAVAILTILDYIVALETCT